MAIGSRLKHAWNAFADDKYKFGTPPTNIGASYGVRPDRVRYRHTNDRSIISSIYTRIAIDVAQIGIRHVKVDDKDRFLENVRSGLQECLRVEANLDQGARAFRQDIVMTLFDEGVVAIVPVDTTLDPSKSGSFDIKTMRVGKVVEWYPKHVKVDLYNPTLQQRVQIVLEKQFVAIVENPLYSVMNEPNSTLQRLIRKISLMDSSDERIASGKLDLIIQLPYVIKTEARRQQAEARRKDIEFQMTGSQYGIAYTDGTEKITQLNRPAENNLPVQVELLTKMLFGQLGITEEVMNGTADEKTMLNYYNRTVEPILDSIIEEMTRKFITKTARTQGQTVAYFRDPFKLIPLIDIAEIADKLTRNEVITSNELRQKLGIEPSTDPKADQLINSNMPAPSALSDTRQLEPSTP